MILWTSQSKAVILVHNLYSPYKPKFLNGHRVRWGYFKDCLTGSSDSGSSSVKAVDTRNKNNNNNKWRNRHILQSVKNHETCPFILIIDGTSKQHKRMAQNAFIKV